MIWIEILQIHILVISKVICMQDFILIRITRILWPFSHRVSVVRGPNLLLPVKKMKPMLLAKLLGDSPDITSSRSMFLKSHFLFE